MPITKSAKKKERQEKKRRAKNTAWKRLFKKTLKAYKEKPSSDDLNKAQSTIDKVAKRNIIHKNKAARLKSKLAKLLESKPEKPQIKKKAVKKKKTT